MVVLGSPQPNAYGASSEDFEKWIRLATDNKITTQNSWDAALIDYFHDLSLLRDGDGINFQKASATLDGCVKIYSSRVDSAVTETGRLMNGLSTSKIRSDVQDGDSEDEEEEDDLDPNGDVVKRIRKPRLINQKDTLVEFKVIQIKKMDLELYVDPIFKKALTDFDEGGSKSLLLNMLKVDEDQKVVFDTTASTEAPKEDGDEIEDEEEIEDVEHSFAEMDIDQEDLVKTYDITSLGERFFANSNFESLSVCPSIKELNAVLNQETTTSDVLKGLESIPLNEFYFTQEDPDSEFNHDMSFGGDAGGHDFDGVPIPDSAEQNDSKYPGNRTSIFFNDLEEEADDYGNTIRDLFHEEKTFATENDIILAEKESFTNIPDEELLAYFDEHQRKQWAGPDHWKVQRIKKAYNAYAVNDAHNSQNQKDAEQQTPKVRKPKEHLIIDFISNDNYPEEEAIFTSSDTILLPKKDWISKTKNVLPNDMHFTTKNFIQLFTKDQLINSGFYKVKNLDNRRIDETFYAENMIDDINGIPALNNQDFFNDDGDYGGNDDYGAFDDVDDHISPSQSVGLSQMTQKGNGQTPLNYSRVSKKVDVKLLKDNLWTTLNEERSTRKSLAPSTEEKTEEPLKFSDVVTELSTKYDDKTKNDLSTSFCFICLLHLANENGFTISNNQDNSDLIIENFQAVSSNA